MKKKILLSTAAVLAVVIISFIFVNVNKQADIKSESTTDESTAEIAISPSTTHPLNSDLTTDESSSMETTTKASSTKAETSTKKPVVTTTKKTETTTASSSKVYYYNGVAYKPYEVFVTDYGASVYFDEYGRRCAAEALTAAPGVDYDSSYCHRCGSSECGAYTSPYFCVICNKTIPTAECHPESHLLASLAARR